MRVTSEKMHDWLSALLSDEPPPALDDELAAIPRLESLGELPAGTPVLVRGDVDAKPGARIGEGDVRLRSMVETLRFGQACGWKQIVFGHIGRDPEGTLKKVARRLGELLDCDVPLLGDWLDEKQLAIRPAVAQAVRQSAAGSVLVLENTRRYEIERAMWKASQEDLEQLAPRLASLANAFAESLGTTYVNEALSAGSLDSSTAVVPAAMDHVALGRYVAGELAGPMQRCLGAELVVFSGLKTDKLDDLQAMVGRGTLRLVLAGGSLAMALKKAAAQLDGGDFCLGVAENPAHQDRPYFISEPRIEQARQILQAGRRGATRFVMPVDFVLNNGQVAATLGVDDQQLDVGPDTSRLFEKEIGEFLTSAKRGTVAFHNGVLGMFEDPRFEEGTRRFITQLKRMNDAGLEVYVGGGEGGKALERYGQPDWVTHTFTAGGTVLAILGGQPVPYLVALRNAAVRHP